MTLDVRDGCTGRSASAAGFGVVPARRESPPNTSGAIGREEITRDVNALRLDHGACDVLFDALVAALRHEHVLDVFVAERPEGRFIASIDRVAHSPDEFDVFCSISSRHAPRMPDRARYFEPAIWRANLAYDEAWTSEEPELAALLEDVINAC